jgi:hypothetical protein
MCKGGNLSEIVEEGEAKAQELRAKEEGLDKVQEKLYYCFGRA